MPESAHSGIARCSPPEPTFSTMSYPTLMTIRLTSDMEPCGKRPRTSIIPGTAASTSSRNPLTSSEKSTSTSWNDFLQKAWSKDVNVLVESVGHRGDLLGRHGVGKGIEHRHVELVQLRLSALNLGHTAQPERTHFATKPFICVPALVAHPLSQTRLHSLQASFYKLSGQAGEDDSDVVDEL
jgi:hypothetical protein